MASYYERERIPAIAAALLRRLPGPPCDDQTLWNGIYQRHLVDRSYGGKLELALVSLYDRANEVETRLLVDSSEKLHVSCTCTTFRKIHQCKHLHQVILASILNHKLPEDIRPNATILTFQTPAWMPLIEGIHHHDDVPADTAEPADLRWDDQRQIVYALEAPLQSFGGRLHLQVMHRKQTRSGWTEPSGLKLAREQIAQLPDEQDRMFIQMLVGAGADFDSGPKNCLYHSFTIDPDQHALLLKPICQTGRCMLLSRDASGPATQLTWDADEAFDLRIHLREGEGGLKIIASLQRGTEGISPREIPAVYAGGLFACQGRLLRLANDQHIRWIERLMSKEIPPIPVTEAMAFLRRYFHAAHAPPLELPQSLGITAISPTMLPRVKLTDPPPAWTILPGGRFCEIAYDYAGREVLPAATEAAFFDEASHSVVYRDRAAEARALRQLIDAGARSKTGYGGTIYYVAAGRLSDFIITLAAQGWRVEADSIRYRPATGQSFNVSSGIDWFELSGDVQFGQELISLPRLLEAIRKGENSVILADGSTGLLPEKLLRRLAFIGMSAKAEGDKLHLGRSQAMLIDVLLSEEPTATCDETFLKLREGLQRFDGILPADAPASFQGQLRDYQRVGLGWFTYLREFGLGGCLADDMGLGKTVQILALLETRRELFAAGTQKRKPSLVVAPKSVVFNWQLEASRFAPQLKVLNHTGTGRSIAEEHWEQHDLVLTTYGTLLRDAESIRKIALDYAILDESQAIKNSDTATSRVVRLLKADQRLALSGTPVENHLGELWNLLDFLNPGFLGASRAFTKASRQVNPEDMQLLARAVRPFVLRRTKKQVARELPDRTEKTLFCELEGDQRRDYEQLRDHYRAALLGAGPADKMQILTALLRLRQAACHPGLIDDKRAGESSAKLDTLIERIQELATEGQNGGEGKEGREGHKALVFSQFVSLLSIVRNRLDALGIPYAYIDGSTQNRQQQVERFQTDPACPLFLISLKAGGLGLNLTAAEYVFLLDPWWNPAVEAQAIDRAHRIGQTRHVIAYRLIAKDTVEEKVLELQQNKRQLADAIISEDGSLLANLTRDDLQLLLS